MFDHVKKVLAAVKFSASSQFEQSTSLMIEPLEERMMLSTVEIFAAGSTGTENLSLVVDDQVVQTFNNIAGDPDARQFERFTLELEETVSAGQVKIQFSNDLYDPEINFDRNLTVEKIIIDGQTFATNQGDVFSTGTWTNDDGVVPGFGRGDTLHSNGFFQYADSTPQGTQLQVDARGEGGEASFNIQIDGEFVGSFVAGVDGEIINFHTPEIVSADRIRIVFTNDYYNPELGIDLNLVVNSIRVNDTEILTSSDNVFSTGTWTNDDGVVPGFGRGDTLHSNGYFQFGIGESSTESLQLIDQIGAAASVIEVDPSTGRYATLSRSGVVALFNADGSVAAEFGDNGSADLRTLTDLIPDRNFSFNDIGIFPDGSVLLSGSDQAFDATETPFLLKLDPSGAVDSSFNNGFFSETQLGTAARDDGFHRVLVDAAGNATIVGNAVDSNNDVILVRLTANGQVDTSWGNNGEIRILGPGEEGPSGSGSFIIGAEVLADGSVMVAATSNVLDFPATVIAKIRQNGTFDSSYGINGLNGISFVVDLRERAFGYRDFDVDSQGRAVLANSVEAVRLDASGSIDSTFGDDGRSAFADGRNVTDSTEQFFGRGSFVVDNQDRIILTANNETVSQRLGFNFPGTTVVRLGTDGRFDSTFDDDGIQTLDFSTGSVEIDQQGNLLTSTGTTGFDPDERFSPFRPSELSRFEFTG